MPDLTPEIERKSFVQSMQNGFGALVSRLFILIGMPLITALCAYAWNARMEVISNQQQYIMQRVDETLQITRTNETRINALENNVGRIQEHEVNTDQRLTRLEGRVK